MHLRPLYRIELLFIQVVEITEAVYSGVPKKHVDSALSRIIPTLERSRPSTYWQRRQRT